MRACRIPDSHNAVSHGANLAPKCNLMASRRSDEHPFSGITPERKRHSQVSGGRLNECLTCWRRGWDCRFAAGIESPTSCAPRQLAASLLEGLTCACGATSPVAPQLVEQGSHPQPSAGKQKWAPLGPIFVYWRRERDSNPRYGITVHSLSRRAP